MTAQHAAVFQQQADELARRAAPRLDGFQRGAADELTITRLHRHGPRETRLERMGLLVHVVAVEVHASLQAQRIASAKTAGCHPESIQLTPNTHSVRRRQHHLEAILSGVARAGHEPAFDLTADECIELESEQRGGLKRQQFRRLGARLSPLNSEHGEIGALEHRRRIRGMTTDPGEILVAGAGVHHQLGTQSPDRKYTMRSSRTPPASLSMQV